MDGLSYSLDPSNWPHDVEEAIPGETYKDGLDRAGPDDVGEALIALSEGKLLTRAQRAALICARWLAQEDHSGECSSPGCHDRPVL